MNLFADLLKFAENLLSNPSMVFFLVSMAVVALALYVALVALRERRKRPDR